MRSATRRKVGRDPEYLAYIRSLPCCVCVKLDAICVRGCSQTSLTESAHVGPRGLSQKCPDKEALPLCAEHHREGQFSQHSMGKMFWAHFGLNREQLLAMYQAHYVGESVLDAREVCA